METTAPTIHNGIWTIDSPRGEHRTFRISTVQDGNLKGKRILSLLTGPDNNSDYTGFAFVDDKGIVIWKKHRDSKTYRVYAAMVWQMLTNPDARFFEMGYSIKGERRCLKCNRRLTDPISIELGIGPVCRGE